MGERVGEGAGEVAGGQGEIDEAGELTDLGRDGAEERKERDVERHHSAVVGADDAGEAAVGAGRRPPAQPGASRAKQWLLELEQGLAVGMM